MSRIPLGKGCQLAFCIKKLENLPMGAGIALPTSGVDLVPGDCTAQHYSCGCWQEGKTVKSHPNSFNNVSQILVHTPCLSLHYSVTKSYMQGKRKILGEAILLNPYT